jgi:WD40 repeat protein
LWDVATHRQITALAGHAGPVGTVAFSPDGKALTTGNIHGSVWVWDVATGRPICNPIATPTASSVAFSPDGETLASASADGTIHLWAVATGQPIGLPITGHAGPVTSLVFSPDGETLAAGSANGTVHLWDVATHRQITALTGHTGAVTLVAFSPDGKALASGSADQTVRLWDVAYLVDVVQRLCASAGRPVTRAEWARYVPGPSYQRVCP